MRNNFLLLTLALMSACSSADESADNVASNKIITTNDFESVAGWGCVDLATLEHGQAHSGHYSLKVDGGHEFSLTFDMALGVATPSKIKTVRLDAWAYLPSDKATGVLGIQIMEPAGNAQTYGEGIRLGEVVKEYGKWVKVSKDFVLPDNITAMQHLRMSLWRAGASDYVLIDDIRLSIKN